MDSEGVRALLRAEIRKCGTAAAWAKANGEMSPSYVGDVVNGGREPGKAILQALGLSRVTRYEGAPVERQSPSNLILQPGEPKAADNAEQALWELDRCTAEFDFARWAQKWGRPALEALIGPLNRT